MKKEYNAPKAEKMQFNYSEAVVASGTGCDWYITFSQGPEGCTSHEERRWHPEVNT